MLKIRLSRTWKHKSPFFRIVLTESTKPCQSWYKDILWWFDPIKHNFEVDIEKTKNYISKWACPSERVAKMLYKKYNDEIFKKFFIETEKYWKTKKEEKK